MKKYFAILYFFISALSITAQEFDGYIKINSQAELDAFFSKYEKTAFPEGYIDGSIHIVAPDVTNLSAFYNIMSISGELEITATALTNLEGLQGILIVIEELYIANNPKIKNLKGFNTLIFAQKITIEHNVALTDFCTLKTDVIIPAKINISDNKYNPTKEDLIAKKCRLQD